MTMPFGKHSGDRIENLPSDYLRWLHDATDLKGRLREAVADEYNHRFRTHSAPPRKAIEATTLSIDRAHVSMVREIVEAGYKATARRHHPDAGGEHGMMQLLNAAAASLRSQLTALEVTR